LGLGSQYMANEEVRHFCGMIDGLAFLPEVEIAEGMAYLKSNVPEVNGLEDLLSYFDVTYVSGALRSSTASTRNRPTVLRLRRAPPLYPSSIWNMHEATLQQQERTNNVCEGWNNSFASLVGRNHPSIWTLLQSLQQDQVLAATDMLQDARGQPLNKRCKRSTEQHEQRLYRLCCDRRDAKKSVPQTLQALGHCIRLVK